MADDTTLAPSTAAEVSTQAKEPVNQFGAEVSLESVYDIPVEISVVLGKASMSIDQLLKMGSGAIIELQRKVGEPVDVYVNGRIVARGEVVIVEDKIGITMTEIIKLES